MLFLYALLQGNAEIATLLNSLNAVISSFIAIRTKSSFWEKYSLYSTSLYFIFDLILLVWRSELIPEDFFHHIGALIGIFYSSTQYPEYINQNLVCLFFCEISGLILPFFRVAMKGGDELYIPEFLNQEIIGSCFLLVFFVARFLILPRWLIKQEKRYLKSILLPATIITVLSIIWLLRLLPPATNYFIEIAGEMIKGN